MADGVGGDGLVRRRGSQLRAEPLGVGTQGRPNLLKETLPFWLIALGTIVFLSLATSLAHHLALSMGLRPIPRLAFVGAAYLIANTVTFLSRFAIFHYVLFAERGTKESALTSAESPSATAMCPRRPHPRRSVRGPAAIRGPRSRRRRPRHPRCGRVRFRPKVR